MDIDGRYTYTGTHPLTGKVIEAGGYIELYNMPDNYDRGSLKAWLRSQIAMICATLFSTDRIRSVLMTANEQYRLGAREVIYSRGIG